MRRDLHERRHTTWQLLVVDGVSKPEAVDRIATAYDVTQETVRDDIDRMGEWLPELDSPAGTGGASRCQELRTNRQRLHEMAHEARDQDDHRLELDIRREIRREINFEQSLREATADKDDEVTTFKEEWIQSAKSNYD